MDGPLRVTLVIPFRAASRFIIGLVALQSNNVRPRRNTTGRKLALRHWPPNGQRAPKKRIKACWRPGQITQVTQTIQISTQQNHNQQRKTSLRSKHRPTPLRPTPPPPQTSLRAALPTGGGSQRTNDARPPLRSAQDIAPLHSTSHPTGNATENATPTQNAATQITTENTASQQRQQQLQRLSSRQKQINTCRKDSDINHRNRSRPREHKKHSGHKNHSSACRSNNQKCQRRQRKS